MDSPVEVENRNPWAWNSADVDWCEGNYEKTQYIAEYYNTISNILFFIIPPIMIHLSQPYSRYVTPDINLCWVLLIIVGIGSGYFHATLSLSGQLIDEIGIVWAMLSGCAISMPRKLFDNIVFKKSRLRFKTFLLFTAIGGTALLFWYPALNAFILMASALPIFIVLAKQIVATTNWRAVRLGFATLFWWVAAATAWVNDRAFCQLWMQSGIAYPQFHSFWHLMVVLASYTAIVFGMYFSALEERPELHPQIAYWPRDKFEFGVPFIRFDNTTDPLVAESLRQQGSSVSKGNKAL